jgi:hypothetical protein
VQACINCAWMDAWHVFEPFRRIHVFQFLPHSVPDRLVMGTFGLHLSTNCAHVLLFKPTSGLRDKVCPVCCLKTLHRIRKKTQSSQINHTPSKMIPATHVQGTTTSVKAAHCCTLVLPASTRLRVSQNFLMESLSKI